MDAAAFEKYPLVKRAFDEQDALFRARGMPLPPQLTQLQQRGIAVLEQHAALPAPEKEALLAAVVLSTAPPEMFGAPARFAKDYSPEVQAIVDKLGQVQPGVVMPAPLARITVALNVAMMEDALARAKAGELRPAPEEAEQIRRGSDAQEPLLANLDCAPLRAAYDGAKKTLFDAFASLPRLRVAGGPPKYAKLMAKIDWPPKHGA